MEMREGGSRDPADGVPTSEDAPASLCPPFPVVGVGASAGGMEAFIELLQQIPRDSGTAFVLIQHLNPAHTSYLSEAIARSTNFPVHEIQDGMRVEPDHVYVIPPTADVGILDGALTLVPRLVGERKPHLPIDFFFQTLAEECGSRAIGVLLSGTGADGSGGLRAIKAREGITFVQTPASAKFSGMPEAAISAGVVDFTLPIPALARELLRIGGHPYLRGPQAQVAGSPTDDIEVKKVVGLLRDAVGVDFSEYKLNSIRRRLARRMALRRITTLPEYVQLLQQDRAEGRALFDEALIHVTSFFRDGEAFEKLKDHVFPEVLQRKGQGGTIRIWSAGCSTGEEPYSLLISLLEFLTRENAADLPIQLFGTDISETAIGKARLGVYPEAAARDIDPERLARFFTRVEGGGYRINKSVRERCAFVKHNLAVDPPFSRLDLVCCRNALIYFGQELQKRVLANFHFALNEPGFLLLGRAENIAGSDLFRAIDEENKLFARTSVRSTLLLTPTRDVLPLAFHGAELHAPPPPDVVRRTESLLLDQYAPPGVVVNERMEILYFRGRTGPYLEPAPGQPQHDLLKMARKGLVADIRIAFSQAIRTTTTARRSGVSFERDGSNRTCDVVVVPVAAPPESREPIFAILFEEGPEPAAAAGGSAPREPATAAEQERTAGIEDELKAAKDFLQTVIEEHHRANQALHTAYEELLSTNEELQSLNEELQTAKEELVSTNEELSTLNEELHARNEDLNAVNSDLVNILGSVDIPIVIVDGSRRIRRFTPRARPILNLLPADVGRPIDDIRSTLLLENLDSKIAEVIDTVTQQEEEVRDRAGHWYRLQIRPYTTVDKRVDGAVLSVVDIDALKRALGAAEWARDYAMATVDAVQTPLIMLDENLELVSANEAFMRCYGSPLAQSPSRRLPEIMNGAWNIPVLTSELARVRERDERFQGLEVTCDIPALGPRLLSLSGTSVPTPGKGRLFLLGAEDITQRRRAEAERDQLLHEMQAARASAEEANRTKDIFLATLSHELRTPLSTLMLHAELLRAEVLDEAELKNTAAVIDRAARAQSQLIDDLLDVSRIATGKLRMEMQAVSLGSVMQSALETVGPAAAAKDIAVNVHIDDALPPVSGDPVRLQQMFWNLLSNAIKFTPDRGRVSVVVDSADGRARIRVTDTGIGIAPSFLPHIFSRFSQEDAEHTRVHGGLGLGLAIVRHVAEAHGGSVRAESAGKSHGSTFTVLLPLVSTQALAASRPDVPAAAGQPLARGIAGARILVVENDAGTRDALTRMLRLSGAVVWSAESAATAMQVFEDLRPELLVCDIAMPEEDGYSLIARIRALGPARGGDVAAVALTAFAGEEDRRRAFAAGFQLHMAKPVAVQPLVAALAGLLKPSPRIPV